MRPSPVVRRYIASALSAAARPRSRWTVLAALARPRRGRDRPQPAATCTGTPLEPLAPRTLRQALKLAADGQDSDAVRRSWPGGSGRSARRRRSTCSSKSLARGEDRRGSGSRTSAAFRKALKGKRDVPMPKDWTAAFADADEVAGRRTSASRRSASRSTFGDKTALAHAAQGAGRRQGRRRRPARGARRRCVDAKRRRARRRCFMRLSRRGPALRAALRGLAAFDDAEDAGRRSSPRTRTFTLAEKRDALATLAARAGLRARHCWTRSRRRRSRPTDVPADVVRQLRNLERRGARQADRRRVGRRPRRRPRTAEAAHRRVEEASSAPQRRPPPTWTSAGPCSPRRACSATRSTASAARSARTSPARTAATSTTCWRTSSTPARSSRRSTPPRRIDLDGRPDHHRHRQGARRTARCTVVTAERDADHRR